MYIVDPGTTQMLGVLTSLQLKICIKLLTSPKLNYSCPSVFWGIGSRTSLIARPAQYQNLVHTVDSLPSRTPNHRCTILFHSQLVEFADMKPRYTRIDYIFIEKNLHIIRQAQLKPMLFKSQVYLICFYCCHQDS